MTPGMMSLGRAESRQLAGEIRCVARRIEKALPLRKFDVKQILRESSKTMEVEIERGSSERSGLQAMGAFQNARDTARLLHHELDQLSMIQMGGKADVTTALELLERMDEVVGNLLALMAESPDSADGDCMTTA